MGYSITEIREEILKTLKDLKIISDDTFNNLVDKLPFEWTDDLIVGNPVVT